MMTGLIYLANILSALFFFMVVLITIAVCIYGVSFAIQYMADDDEKEKETEKAKRIRKKWLPVLIASTIWLTFVPDGKTFLAMKAADTIGDERVIELLEVMDGKLLEELEKTVDYD